MVTIVTFSILFVIFALLIIVFKPNFLFVLFALEIILLGINLNFVLASFLHQDFFGYYITLLLFSVASLDSSVGLIILLEYYKLFYISKTIGLIKG